MWLCSDCCEWWSEILIMMMLEKELKVDLVEKREMNLVMMRLIL